MWRHLPNLISAARLASTPVLLVAALTDHRSLFTWLLLACLLSDILDGVLARAFQLNSELGALLDSTADMLTTLCALFGIWRFERAFVTEHAAPLLLILTLYVGEGIAAFFRYGRISSFHTILARVAAYLQGIFIMCLFLWGYSDWVFTPMVLLSVISLTEELILLALLREWRPDVRGLWWLLRA